MEMLLAVCLGSVILGAGVLIGATMMNKQVRHRD